LIGLESFKSQTPKIMYPGHGHKIDNPLKAIDSIINFYADEAEIVHECLKSGPKTLFQIYQEKQPGIISLYEKAGQPLLSLSCPLFFKNPQFRSDQ